MITVLVPPESSDTPPMGAPEAFLFPAAALYRSVMETKRLLYSTGALRRRQATVPVVCIGNLSLGGTGKTPMVEYVARMLPRCGKWPAIVARGYKRSTPQSQLIVVSNGNEVLATAAEAGDEPLLLARSLKGIAVAVCSNRHKACEELVRLGLCDCVVLDDGFQHWPLARNADVVLIDSTVDLSTMRIFPAGTLREPLSGLKRAWAVIHTRVGDPEAKARRQDYYISNRTKVSTVAPGVPQFAARFLPEKLVRLSKPSGPEIDIGDLPGMRVAAFAGIAKPEAFFGTLNSLGADVSKRPFPDHASYTYRDIAQVLDFAVAEECEAVITTSKDAVKLMSFELPAEPPIYMLTQSIELDYPEEFQSLLLAAVQ